MRKRIKGDRLFRGIVGLLVMATGVWIISMAIKGETPAQAIDSISHARCA